MTQAEKSPSKSYLYRCSYCREEVSVEYRYRAAPKRLDGDAGCAVCGGPLKRVEGTRWS